MSHTSVFSSAVSVVEVRGLQAHAASPFTLNTSLLILVLLPSTCALVNILVMFLEAALGPDVVT